MDGILRLNQLFFGTAVLFVCLLFTGCNQHDDQRQFEQQALRLPDGLTEMDVHGQPSGQADSDDWRISPFFQSIVQIITPPFPNPALTSDGITFDIDITGLDQVNGLYLYSYNHLTGETRLVDHEPGTFESGPVSLRFNGSELAALNNGIGTYRIILQDGTYNFISYGDIQVQ